MRVLIARRKGEGNSTDQTGTVVVTGLARNADGSIIEEHGEVGKRLTGLATNESTTTSTG